MSSQNWQADKDGVSSAAACFGALKHPRKMLLSDPSGSDLTGVPFSICYPFDSSFYLRSVSKTQPMLCVKKQWDLHRMTWMKTKDARPNDNGLNNERLYNNVLIKGGSNEDYPTMTKDHRDDRWLSIWQSKGPPFNCGPVNWFIMLGLTCLVQLVLIT